MSDLEILSQKIKLFAEERDWEQFHSPKNLSMALAGEVGELLEHFQWLTEEQSGSLGLETRSEVAQELRYNYGDSKLNSCGTTAI